MDDDLPTTAAKAPAVGGEEAQLLRALQQLQQRQSGGPAASALLDGAVADAELGQAPAAGAAGAAGAVDATLFGFSMGALMVGLVMSVVGMGCLRYARAASQYIFVVPGVIFMAVPFWVTDAWALSAILVGVSALTLLVRRFVTF